MNILYLSGFESKQNKFLLATFVLFWVFTSIFYLYGLNFSDGLRFFLQINYFFFINFLISKLYLNLLISQWIA